MSLTKKRYPAEKLSSRLAELFPIPTRRLTCKLDHTKRILTPCWKLESCFEPSAHFNRKGIIPSKTFKAGTGDLVQVNVAVRSGHMTGDGVKGALFNYCPFCGSKILAPVSISAIRKNKG